MPELLDATDMCAQANCATASICEECDQPVCVEHDRAVASCVDGGAHHLSCVADCASCRAASTQDHAEDRAERFAREGW